jgi:drug/metabolite transporter (DMT)-like permease
MVTNSKFIFIIGGVVFSSLAQVCMKIAADYSTTNMKWISLLTGSALAYLLSFVMYYFALKHFPISIVSPAMTVAVVALVTLFGIYSGEILSIKQIIGVALAFLSIAMILL